MTLFIYRCVYPEYLSILPKWVVGALSFGNNYTLWHCFLYVVLSLTTESRWKGSKWSHYSKWQCELSPDYNKVKRQDLIVGMNLKTCQLTFKKEIMPLRKGDGSQFPLCCTPTLAGSWGQVAWKDSKGVMIQEALPAEAWRRETCSDQFCAGRVAALCPKRACPAGSWGDSPSPRYNSWGSGLSQILGWDLSRTEPLCSSEEVGEDQTLLHGTERSLRSADFGDCRCPSWPIGGDLPPSMLESSPG